MKQENGAWCFGAAAGISAVVTAGFGWAEVLTAWGICALLRVILPRRAGGGKPAAVVLLLGGVILAAAAALGAERTFPRDGTFPFVSLGVMVLLWRALRGGPQVGRQVGNVLGLILLPLLTLVLVFGLRDVQWQETIPQGFRWNRVWITLGVIAPWWAALGQKGDWSWFSLCALASVGMSLMTRGLLGAALTEATDRPLYLAVQSVHALGGLQRFEALLAAAVLLGSFGMALFAEELLRRGLAILLPETGRAVGGGTALGISFLLELAFRYCPEGLAGRIGAVFWGAAPIFALWLVFFTKSEKIEKSS